MANEPTAGIKKMTIEAIITRADGTVENLGTIVEYNAPDREKSEAQSAESEGEPPWPAPS